jgi:hypothetical protein
MVAVAIRAIFAQPKAETVRDQLDVIAWMLGRQASKVEAMLRDAAPDLVGARNSADDRDLRVRHGLQLGMIAWWASD